MAAQVDCVRKRKEGSIVSNVFILRYKLIGLALLLCVGAVVGAGIEVRAGQNRDPLIEVLIRKGILTEQEAAEIQKEAKALEEQRQREVVETVKKEGVELPKGLKNVSVGMLGYLDYSSGKSPESGDKESSYNEFRVTRGYLTVKKQILPWMGARITSDVHQDDTGDYKVRLKYYYAEFKAGDLGPLTDMKSEFGMGHIPWLDFEEHVNPYRCQGTMAVERAGVFNSSDLGLGLQGYLGGDLEDAESRTGMHYYTGRYGSWHLGVYNGSGYHASENNNDKVLEGRVTLRPLPAFVPGLQLSYFTIYGEGNRRAVDGEYPDYVVNLGMVSYENPLLILTAQYFRTRGNASGKWVDIRGDALDTAGYSFFGNFKLPVFERKLSLFARYDHFDADVDDEIARDTAYDMFIGGIAYDFYHSNMLVLAYETTDYEHDSGGKGGVPVLDNRLGDDYKLQLVYQVSF
jgi:hypothetical protein